MILKSKQTYCFKSNLILPNLTLLNLTLPSGGSHCIVLILKLNDLDCLVFYQYFKTCFKRRQMTQHFFLQVKIKFLTFSCFNLLKYYLLHSCPVAARLLFFGPGPVQPQPQLLLHSLQKDGFKNFLWLKQSWLSL